MTDAAAVGAPVSSAVGPSSAVSDHATSDLWWKHAVVYCLDVETFLDSDGDGIGDFRGLTEKVDYLAGLGVTVVWLMPFYPSPNRDNGYDVADHYGIDPRLGTFGDFVDFLRTARERGIRVIADLVVNHTSIEHPWFRAARADPESPFRDFYVWSDEPIEQPEVGLIFPGQEDDVWTYDREAGRYYFHRFYGHQADLNVNNPRVRDEIHRVMGFWLQLGLSGFRVDAVPFLIEQVHLPGEPISDPHGYLRDLRAFLGRRQGDAVLLAEANEPPEVLGSYFGDGVGDEMHMVFDFIGNQALYLALVRGSAEPIGRALRARPPKPATGQWATFVRNHDELSLDKLAEAERAEVFAAFAPDPAMRIFERGIRRRLPSMLDGERRRIELMYSLLFSLPGTPVLFYGEEIGMAEDLGQPWRDAVRSPMQWSAEPNGGFSKAPPGALVRPSIDDGPFSYRRVNVGAQRQDDRSLLNWMERAIRLRKEWPAFGWGEWQVHDTGVDAVLVHSLEWLDECVLAIHNLGARARRIEFTVPDGDPFPHLFGSSPLSALDAGPARLTVDGHGYHWFGRRARG